MMPDRRFSGILCSHRGGDYTRSGWTPKGWGWPLSQQNENVLFGQSRNVLLTGSSLGRGRRTTADDPGRARPASGLEEGQEETDHAEAGSRGGRVTERHVRRLLRKLRRKGEEQPTRLRVWRGGSPCVVNCLIQTTSRSDACGGNKACFART